MNSKATIIPHPLTSRWYFSTVSYLRRSATCAAVQLSQNDEQERDTQEPGHGGGRLVSLSLGTRFWYLYTDAVVTSCRRGADGPVVASLKKDFKGCQRCMNSRVKWDECGDKCLPACDISTYKLKTNLIKSKQKMGVTISSLGRKALHCFFTILIIISTQKNIYYLC